MLGLFPSTELNISEFLENETFYLVHLQHFNASCRQVINFIPFEGEVVKNVTYYLNLYGQYFPCIIKGN